MKFVLLLLVASIVAACVVLALWRQSDHRSDQAEMDRLIRMQPDAPLRFNRRMVADLPDAARRYLTFAIAEGTPLHTVAEIDMTGRFSLGRKDRPNYLSMTAKQVLAPPHGFVWAMSGGSGVMRVSGSDSGGWTRFWLAGLAPVARFGGSSDHARSAFGRYAAEAVFWAPAALLPSDHVTWDAVDDSTARFTMSYGGLVQSADVTVDSNGRPIQVMLQRWSNANPQGVFRWQPFGGYLSEFETFDGFTIPTHVEAGNAFGTDDYFPFFIADVTAFRLPHAQIYP
ncbi:DUF6544 family protein [uncultured Algimonas sp.]|uniref:DUF6544 family protein n=1 Tax=uncultured Algimonas sp. TaxID=1547920 RepID=UPI0026347617|nr:DUF6544 family protein [uncultured Algimonas sp.]